MVIQEDIHALESWCADWSLNLHPDKCIALRFGLDSPDCPIYLVNGSPVNTATSWESQCRITCLGVSTMTTSAPDQCLPLTRAC